MQICIFNSSTIQTKTLLNDHLTTHSPLPYASAAASAASMDGALPRRLCSLRKLGSSSRVVGKNSAPLTTLGREEIVALTSDIGKLSLLPVKLELEILYYLKHNRMSA